MNNEFEEKREDIIGKYKSDISNSIKASSDFDDLILNLFGGEVDDSIYNDLKDCYDKSQKYYDSAEKALKMGLNSTSGVDYTSDMQKNMDEGARYFRMFAARALTTQLIQSGEVDKMEPDEVWDYLVERDMAAEKKTR